MKRRTFEDFLQDIFQQANPGILDDDLEDMFNTWLGNKDAEDIIKWGDLYGQEQYLVGIEETLKN